MLNNGSLRAVIRLLFVILHRFLKLKALFQFPSEGGIYNKVYGVYVENARDVEIDDLRVQVGLKVNYGGKTFGIDD